jgi:hypothetical protein
MAAGASRTFVAANQCNISATARSLSVNATVTRPSADGFLTIYPDGVSQPVVSTINYQAGRTRANNAIVVLGSAGDFVVYCGQASGTVDFILDVNGYFQ